MLITTVKDSDKNLVSVATRFLLNIAKRAFQQKVHSSLNLRCRINGGSQDKPRGWRSFLNLINGGRGFNISKYSLISVMISNIAINPVKLSKQSNKFSNIKENQTKKIHVILN